MGHPLARPRVPALLVVLATVGLCLPASAAARGAGAIRTIEQETERACRYAERHADQATVRACRRVESARASAGATLASSYENPIYGSAPDPMAASTGTDYYAYHTGDRFSVLHSTDLVSWTRVGEALSNRPSWVVPSGDWHPWAPSVLRSTRSCPGSTSPGCYFLYYTGLHGKLSPTTHCVGAAYSTTPSGPFTDTGPLTASSGRLDQSGRPRGCGDDAGYSHIDPAPFVDSDGHVYLYLATNRTCATVTPGAECTFRPSISVLRLGSDLLHVAGPRARLFGGDAGTWEDQAGQGPKVENPWVVKRNRTYYLFYSGGAFTAAYGMGYATATTPTGGFKKAPTNPILRETAEVKSPGGGSLIRGPRGGNWMLYHGRAGSYSQPRTMRIDPVGASAGAVVVRGPTTGVQSPAP